MNGSPVFRQMDFNEARDDLKLAALHSPCFTHHDDVWANEAPLPIFVPRVVERNENYVIIMGIRNNVGGRTRFFYKITEVPHAEIISHAMYDKWCMENGVGWKKVQ